ncbi:MAG: hypothetical protein ACR2KQ_07795 [Actinomycetota bacterium]
MWRGRGRGLRHAGARVTANDDSSIDCLHSRCYASVFAIEAIGLLLCVPLLRGINVDTFTKDVAAETARRSAAAVGWTLPAPPGVLDGTTEAGSSRDA